MTFSIKGFLLFLFIVLTGFSSAQNSTLKIGLRNIEILEGVLFVSLTNDSLQFANFINPTEMKIKKIKVESSVETVNFEDLEAGWYAIAVFQDLNGNDSLDTKRFGIPVEPFGFSNNAIAKFRKPWFKQSRFYIDADKNVNHTIDLVNRKPKRVKKDKE